MTIQVLQGDCLDVLRTLPDQCVHCCVTSPPYYGLRDYGHDGQIGLEETPEAYVAKLVAVFREVRRVLREDGTLWLNLGDGYARDGGSPGGGNRELLCMDGKQRRMTKIPRGINLKPKDLIGIPWRVAFALQADGWYLRQDIIWSKPAPLPESVTDRCTKSHEYIFLLSQRPRYYFDAEAIKEPATRTGDRQTFGGKKARNGTIPSDDPRSRNGSEQWGRDHVTGEKRNRRSVWTVASKPYPKAHFATYPPELIKPCILAGTSEEGCCPVCGAPWERMVERESYSDRPNSRPIGTRGNQPSLCASNGQPQQGGRHVISQTIGWRPACTCGGLPVPCTVLDPFAGSGTTLAVALEYGRNAIGIELNPEYVALIHERVNESRNKVGLFYQECE